MTKTAVLLLSFLKLLFEFVDPVKLVALDVVYSVNSIVNFTHFLLLLFIYFDFLKWNNTTNLYYVLGYFRVLRHGLEGLDIIKSFLINLSLLINIIIFYFN